MTKLAHPHVTRTDRERAQARLGALGITPTPQRVEIAAILLARPQHLSADEILARVNRRGARVSKATIYNTLALLARNGLVREVIVERSKVFYDSNTRPHHHFYNTSTGTLTDIERCRIEVGDVPALPDGTVVEAVEVVVRVRDRDA